MVDKYKVAAEIANSASPPPELFFLPQPWSAMLLFAHDVFRLPLPRVFRRGSRRVHRRVQARR